MTEIIYLQKRVSNTEDKGLYVTWKDKGKHYVVGPFACVEYAKNYQARAESWRRLVRPRRGEDSGSHDSGLLVEGTPEGGSHSNSTDVQA